MTCSNCNNSGKNPGSDYLDCSAPGCDVATQRMELEQKVRKQFDAAGRLAARYDSDILWWVYQQGLQSGLAALLKQDVEHG